ncbi:MAG TPA: cytochrome c oxidase subunit II [Terriglobales bacterium]|nr:cytochrome c oxidase subunit II [Terriglobales bacterium]
MFPARASNFADKVDPLYLFLVAVAVFFSVGIFLTIAVFAIKYRRSVHPKAEQIEGSLAVEATWSIIPLAIALFIFVWSAAVYYSYGAPPKDALRVYGTAKQWMWKFQHPDGQREINELHVPVGRDVAVTLISQDVIHSFFVPAFRVKMDVLPNRYRTVWFRPTRAGTYHLFCAEYCGTSHAGMIGWVVVMEPADYEAWLASGGEGSLASSGEKLFRHLGCISCHRADKGARGPDLAGLYGREVHFQDGTTVVADENYIRDRILGPRAANRQVAGWQPIMPVFRGQVNEEQMLELIAYVKSLQQNPLNVNPNAPVPDEEQRKRNPQVEPQVIRQ